MLDTARLCRYDVVVAANGMQLAHDLVFDLETGATQAYLGGVWPVSPGTGGGWRAIPFRGENVVSGWVRDVIALAGV